MHERHVRSILCSVFCTVQVLEEQKNLSTLWDSEVSTFQVLECVAVNGNPISVPEQNKNEVSAFLEAQTSRVPL